MSTESPRNPRPASAVPHVSVVVPTYGGRPELLKSCIESLCALDYPDDRMDVHVVDSGPFAETGQVVSDLARSCAKQLRYTKRQGPTGPAASRHLGAMQAKGEIVAFIDDDCEATPNWLHAGVAAFGPRIGLVQGATLPNPTHRRHILEKTIQVTGPSPFFETCNILYSREAFNAVDGFSGPFEKLFVGEDTDLGRRVMAAGWEMQFAAEALVYHAVLDQSLIAWLMECWRVRNVPLLVRHWPEMRRDMFLYWFLNSQSAGFLLGLVGLASIPLIGWWALFAWLPYFAVRVHNPGRYRNPLAILARALLGIPRSTVTFVALAWGSARHRTLLL